jgi:hypothetical protein
MSDPLDQTIRDNAEAPAQATVDGQSARQHPLRDQIEADRYLESKKATRKRGLPIKILRLRPPGAV